MEKIIHNGRKGYFLPEEEKKQLKALLNSAKEYRDSAEALLSLRREVKA